MQLATNDLYKDFILLDACDAVAVDEFLNGNDEVNKTKNNSRGSSIGSKSRKTFMSPSRRSGGFMSPSRRSAGKTVDPGPSQNAYDDKKFETNDHHMDDHGFDMDDGFSQPEAFDDDSDEEDEEDPWKPLNPHEKGNLKIKPFKKGLYEMFCFLDSFSNTSILYTHSVYFYQLKFTEKIGQNQPPKSQSQKSFHLQNCMVLLV